MRIPGGIDSTRGIFVKFFAEGTNRFLIHATIQVKTAVVPVDARAERKQE